MIVEIVFNVIIDVVGGSCCFVLLGYLLGGVLVYVFCFYLLVKYQWNFFGVVFIDIYLFSQIVNFLMNEGFSFNDIGKGFFCEVI